jgi:hypothetical protein
MTSDSGRFLRLVGAAVIAGVVVGALVVTPAGAHVGGTVGHLWTKHIRPLATDIFYTKTQSNTRFVKVGGSEKWREVGAAGQPNFTGGDACPGIPCWQNFPGGIHNTVAFYKDPLGVVHLKGVASCPFAFGNCLAAPSGKAFIFTLPPGYRPAKQEVFPSLTDAGGGLARVDITSAGHVVLRSPNNVPWVTLDGFTFREG